VILKDLQARESVGGILENLSAVFGLFQKRQIRSESKVRREGIIRCAQQAEGDRCALGVMIHGLRYPRGGASSNPHCDYLDLARQHVVQQART